jgi:hypothetical protein
MLWLTITTANYWFGQFEFLKSIYSTERETACIIGKLKRQHPMSFINQLMEERECKDILKLCPGAI